MKREDYITYIEKETGLEHGKDFGFVLGTHSPFPTHSHEFISSDNVQGYKIWRRILNDSQETNYREILTRSMSIEDTIAFLTLSQKDLTEFFAKQGFFIIDTKDQSSLYQSE